MRKFLAFPLVVLTAAISCVTIAALWLVHQIEGTK